MRLRSVGKKSARNPPSIGRLVTISARIARGSSAMEPALMKLLAALERSGEPIERLLREVDGLGLRAVRFTELLHSFWPASPLCACLLETKQESHLCVVDDHGQRLPDCEARLRDPLRQPGQQPGRKTADSKLPAGLKLPGHALVVREVTFCGHRWAVLALAVAKNTAAEIRTMLRVLLAVCGEQLAARLD